jgi:polyisoprenoid-binding protein YceI
MSTAATDRTATALTSAPGLAELSGTYTLDTAHTQIGFVARHAMVTKVRGTFDEFSGTADLDGANPENSSARVAIKTESINTRNAQRDAHLRSNDFLAVDEYPEITFVSTGARQVSDTEWELAGDLTIKGVARSVTVPFTYMGSARDPYGNLRVGFEGAVSINRTDYGITWNAALETGGVLVGDKIVLEFEVSAIKDA